MNRFTVKDAAVSNLIVGSIFGALSRRFLAGIGIGALAFAAVAAAGSATDDRSTVSALDTEYQKAVQRNDTKTMARILADDFVVIGGDGHRWTKADLLEDARSGKTHYEHQEDSDQTVRLWGDTAVVTAKLWAKGIEDGESVDYHMWFSDTYVRTPTGWRYVFGQASLQLPENSRK